MTEELEIDEYSIPDELDNIHGIIENDILEEEITEEEITEEDSTEEVSIWKRERG